MVNNTKEEMVIVRYPPYGLFAYAYSPTQLNGTPGLIERMREIKPYLFPYIIQLP
jgi:hypothetical protein